MPQIEIRFHLSGFNPPLNATARATLLATSAANILVPAGGSQTINIGAGVYAMFVNVMTESDCRWSIDVLASGGDMHQKSDTGPQTVLFSQVHVE